MRQLIYSGYFQGQYWSNEWTPIQEILDGKLRHLIYTGYFQGQYWSNELTPI